MALHGAAGDAAGSAGEMTPDEIRDAMVEKATEFREKGGEIYVEEGTDS